MALGGLMGIHTCGWYLSNICVESNLIETWLTFQDVKLKGGAREAVKRVKHQDMMAKASDIQQVKACFAITKFNSEPWLATLTPQKLAKYMKDIENQRAAPKVVDSTVKHIIEFTTLEVLRVFEFFVYST